MYEFDGIRESARVLKRIFENFEFSAITGEMTHRIAGSSQSVDLPPSCISSNHVNPSLFSNDCARLGCAFKKKNNETKKKSMGDSTLNTATNFRTIALSIARVMGVLRYRHGAHYKALSLAICEFSFAAKLKNNEKRNPKNDISLPPPHPDTARRSF